jgi:transposase
MDNSSSVSTHNSIVVDCDQTDLIANGKTFELAQKGYLPKKKNQNGYQLAATFTGERSETVAMILISGSTNYTDHYDDLLESILSKYNEKVNDGNLILRTDNGFGSTKNIEKLLSIPNLKFVTKANNIIKIGNLF